LSAEAFENGTNGESCAWPERSALVSAVGSGQDLQDDLVQERLAHVEVVEALQRDGLARLDVAELEGPGAHQVAADLLAVLLDRRGGDEHGVRVRHPRQERHVGLGELELERHVVDRLGALDVRAADLRQGVDALGPRRVVVVDEALERALGVLGVTGLPSWNVRPFLRKNVYVRPSSDTSQRSASAGWGSVDR
jgi:hypothetical protein